MLWLSFQAPSSKRRNWLTSVRVSSEPVEAIGATARKHDGGADGIANVGSRCWNGGWLRLPALARCTDATLALSAGLVSSVARVVRSPADDAAESTRSKV